MVHLTSTKCFNTESDLLDLCKVAYPNLKVVNVMRLDEPVKFTIYGCKIGQSDSSSSSSSSKIIRTDEPEKLKDCSKLKMKRVQPYKCLHGEFQSSELYIPPRCQFQHLFSNDGCQTQDHWSLLSNEKCKSSGSILNSSILLQWCDGATNGISTFSGIEFVCCPKVENVEPDQPSETFSEDEDIDDDQEEQTDETEEVEESNQDQQLLENNSLIGNEEKKINDIYEENKIDSSDANILPDEQIELTINEAKNENANDFNYASIKLILDKIDINKEDMSDMEAAEGTVEQKEQYEKQKKLIISSIQNSLDNVS